MLDASIVSASEQQRKPGNDHGLLLPMLAEKDLQSLDLRGVPAGSPGTRRAGPAGAGCSRVVFDPLHHQGTPRERGQDGAYSLLLLAQRLLVSPAFGLGQPEFCILPAKGINLCPELADPLIDEPFGLCRDLLWDLIPSGGIRPPPWSFWGAGI